MHRRLIVAFLTLAVAIIALYGVPRVLMVADLVHASEQQYAKRMASMVGTVIDAGGDAAAVDEKLLARMIIYGERVAYTAPDGTTVTTGADAEPDDITGTSVVRGGGTVTFTRSGEIVNERVSKAVTPVIMIGVGLLIVATVAAIQLARSLSRPFLRLLDTVREIGRGNLRPPKQSLGVPEARAIDAALRESAQALEDRLRREHEFASNASHQLRTPITALRLELEDLSLWPETPPVVRDQLDHAVREIDRLSDAIAQLLALARGDTPGATTFEPLAESLHESAARWQAQADAAGRAIRVARMPDGLGEAPAAASQIIDVLLHNALRHGRGDITIDAERRAEYVTVQVGDEGRRPRGNSIFQRRAHRRSDSAGEGIGLALSVELAESLGGHLLLDGSSTTTFSLMLPARG
ncbi:HAMP domain-containing histidine kinase [Microbacterium sp. Re1]|uniref:histidine kinase n=1 Tax=Microbacterium commune TaxID=2762219 RepID=A0ABR8W4C7_9MICO|nr:HAMP domain-containing sensor histidine kinase [Microbacterium commune]MBD8011884.1 HAMP domain-containing histidine kinase [Microbacterium commune]